MVYLNFDFEIKCRKLELVEKVVKGMKFEFFLFIIEVEKRFLLREWFDVRGELNIFIFFSFNVRVFVGFVEKLGLFYKVVGLKYVFFKFNYEFIEGEFRELFFLDEEKFVKIVKGKGVELVFVDFLFGFMWRGDIVFLNLFCFFYIGFFELKYFFGFDWLIIVDKNVFIDFVVGLMYEGFMELMDGVNLIWCVWRWGR